MAGPPGQPRRVRGPTIPDPAKQAARLGQQINRKIGANLSLSGAAGRVKRWTIAKYLRDLTGEGVLRRLGGKSGMPSHLINPRKMKAHRHSLAQRIEPLLAQHPHLLPQFSVSSPYELAQLVLEVELSLRRGIGTRTTTELATRGSTRTGGLFGDVAGRLLEVVAFRNKGIDAQLKADASAVLTALIRRGKPLQTIDGSIVTLGKFSTPERATKMFTVVRDSAGKIIEHDEFVDFGYMSGMTPKGAKSDAEPDFFLLGIIGDVKVPGQVRKAGEKFRDATGRLRRMTDLEVVLGDSLTPIFIPRRRLLHTPDDVKYVVASSVEGQKGPGYVRRFTRARGKIVAFPVLSVEVTMVSIYDLVRLMLRP